MMKIPCAAIALAIWISPYAGADTKTSIQHNKCIERIDHSAMKNSQLTSCATQEIKRQDATLNAEYNGLRGSLSVEQKEQLTRAQKSWLKFREEWCRFEEIGPSEPGGEAGRALCIIDMTNRQIDLIKAQ